MKTITTTDELETFCQEAAQHPYVTVDTEFLRERTYFSKLCLVQLAYPGKDNENAVLVDPLADGLSLEPLYALFRNESVVKVFHAARQDLEIFWVDAQVFPTPLFDTQVAAMVCGFGEQVGYETLVRKIVKQGLDKTSRFTDWSRRPLSDAQKTYARRRVKTRTNSGKFLAVVRELAAFRETYAKTNNVPRNRVFKDDALVELASTKPRSASDLGNSRLLLREARKGAIADGILEAIAKGVACRASDLPQVDKSREKMQVNPALADLLRVLLKAKTEASGVAAKLIAPSADLDAIAAGQRNVPALNGWRLEVFGADALRLCNGEIALAAKGQSVKVVTL
jgi:ribonuclease D